MKKRSTPSVVRIAPRKGPRGAFNPAYRINVIERAIDVLRAFTSQAPELRLGEVAEAANLSNSTALRILTTLRGQGLVVRHAQSGLYSLGYDLVALAEAAKAQSGLIARALPALRRIHETLDETTFLSIRSGDHRIDIEQIVSRQNLRLVIALGERKLLYVGAGSKVLLAGAPDAEIADYLKRIKLAPLGERTIADSDAMWADIKRTRRLGFSEGVREAASDSASVAAPIIDSAARVIGAISVIAPVSRYTPAQRKRIIDTVLECAAEASSQFNLRRAAND